MGLLSPPHWFEVWFDSVLRADVVDEKVSQPDEKWEAKFDGWTEAFEKEIATKIENLKAGRPRGSGRRKALVKPTYQGPQLARMNLRFTRIKDSSLVGARLEGANLEGALLTRSDLRFARFYTDEAGAANCANAFLEGANLQGANLYGAKLQGASLSVANLHGAVLREAKLKGADLRSADLQGAVLREAKLKGANLWNAKLQGANLIFAKLQGADLSEAKLQAADLREAKLQGANLGYADLQGADLFLAKLKGANLYGAKLQGADLRGANLERALLSLVNRSKSKNTEKTEKQEPASDQKINFEGATLWGALLYEADLKTAEYLTPEQVREACCDEKTEFPPNIREDIKKQCIENGLTVDGQRFLW